MRYAFVFRAALSRKEMGSETVPLLTLRLLGGLEVKSAEGRDVTPPGRKMRALFACLALPPRSAWSREQLIDLLWGDRDEEQARGSLREALVKLRRSLGEPSPLQAGRETVALDPAVISIDAVEFARLVKAGELERAADLYRGELLEGLSLPDAGFRDWLLVERTRLHDLAVDVLSKLLASQDGGSAIRTARRLLQIEPTREETHRALVRLYAAAGDRSQALRQYQICRDGLRREFGVTPSPETEALHRQIRDGPGHKASRIDESGRSSPITRKHIEAERGAADGAPTSAARRRSRSHRSSTVLATLAGIAFALLAVAGFGWYWTRGGPVAVTTPSIAVLPFDNLGDVASGRLADGMTEEIITDLARFRDFEVIARESTAVYKGKPVDVREIGKDLKVRYALEGSFQSERDKVHIRVRLVDTSTGANIWSESYDKPAEDIFAVQSEVADRVANSLGGSIGIVSSAALAAARRKQPGDLDAYELYLLGTEARQGLTDDSLVESAKLLERAIAIDPALARAHVALAWTYSRRALFAAEPSEFYRKMLQEARRAVELDPMDGEAHAALGYVLGFTDFKQSEMQFDEALRLNPNGFDTLKIYACWANSFGKGPAGAEAVDRAIRLNPNYPRSAVDCFRYALFMVGRHEDVLRNQARLPEEQWNPDGYVMTAGSLAALGRLEEAKALAARGFARFPTVVNIEAFALRRGWAPQESAILSESMRKAGFPACVSEDGSAGLPRLPECVRQ
jgi:TolB-like protein/DNA-binding SARP family transcriptional activator